MIIKPTKTISAFFAIILITVMSDARPAHGDESFTIYWENDGTFLKPNHDTDRHYTDGLKVAFTHQPDGNRMRDFGRWNNFGGKDANVFTALGYFFGQNMFTPDHADKPADRDAHDRVFAGWLFGGIFAQRATEKEMEHFELNLGVIGQASLASETQDFVHKALHLVKSKGWEDQLDNELAADFTWFKRQLLDIGPLRRTSNFDAQLEYGITAGSVYRNANAGVILRLGKDIPNDFGPGRLEAPASACGPISEDRSYFYVFGRAGAKYVDYDRFLSGLDTEPMVGQFQFGVVWRKKAFQISYSQTFLTREYKKQPEADSYASLNLTYWF